MQHTKGSASGVAPDVPVAPDPLQGLDALLSEPDELDEEFLRPTDHAVAAARGLVSAVCAPGTGQREPLPAFSTTGDGSLYISWKRGTREVRILVPPQDNVPIRLYYRNGEEDGVDGRVSPAVLKRRLQWVARG